MGESGAGRVLGVAVMTGSGFGQNRTAVMALFGAGNVVRSGIGSRF